MLTGGIEREIGSLTVTMVKLLRSPFTDYILGIHLWILKKNRREIDNTEKRERNSYMLCRLNKSL